MESDMACSSTPRILDSFCTYNTSLVSEPQLSTDSAFEQTLETSLAESNPKTSKASIAHEVQPLLMHSLLLLILVGFSCI